MITIKCNTVTLKMLLYIIKFINGNIFNKCNEINVTKGYKSRSGYSIFILDCYLICI